MPALIRVAHRHEFRRVEIRFFAGSPKGEMRDADAIAIRIHVQHHYHPLGNSGESKEHKRGENSHTDHLREQRDRLSLRHETRITHGGDQINRQRGLQELQSRHGADGDNIVKAIDVRPLDLLVGGRALGRRRRDEERSRARSKERRRRDEERSKARSKERRRRRRGIRPTKIVIILAV